MTQRSTMYRTLYSMDLLCPQTCAFLAAGDATFDPPKRIKEAAFGEFLFPVGVDQYFRNKNLELI